MNSELLDAYIVCHGTIYFPAYTIIFFRYIEDNEGYWVMHTHYLDNNVEDSF